MSKLREIPWKERDRMSQLGAALYPHLADDSTKQQMLARAAEDGEAKRASFERRLRQGEHMYGKPNPKPGGDYSRVPGLRKVEK